MNEATRLDRRAFLGFAAGGAAGLLLPSVIRPRPKVFDLGRGLTFVRDPRARFYASDGRLLGESPLQMFETLPVEGLAGFKSREAGPVLWGSSEIVDNEPDGREKVISRIDFGTLYSPIRVLPDQTWMYEWRSGYGLNLVRRP